MTGVVRAVVFVFAITILASAADAQFAGAGFPGGFPGPVPYAYGAPYGVAPYGLAGGFGPNGGLGGYGRYGGHNYGTFNFAQQLFQQQSSLTQQIFQQQQAALIGQVHEAEGRLARLDSMKQQMFTQYLNMSDSEKTQVRVGLMNDYLGLDERTRAAWKRDAVAQIVIGQDMPRLDGLAQYRSMSGDDRQRFRQAMIDKYHGLTPQEQQAWQSDPILSSVMGGNWWLK
jgi:hypothetical protein